MNPHKGRCSLCTMNDMAAMLEASSSYQPARKNGNIYTSEPARPPRPYSLDIHLSSDLPQKANSLEKNQRISLFHAIHQDHISDKVNMVA